MSAQVLREAASRMRHDIEHGQAWGDDSFLSAVADWLEQMSFGWNLYENHAIRNTAIVTARAYLGGAS